MSPEAMQLAHPAMPVARGTRYSVSHVFKGIPLCHEDGSIPDFAPFMGAFFIPSKTIRWRWSTGWQTTGQAPIQGVATLS